MMERKELLLGTHLVVGLFYRFLPINRQGLGAYFLASSHNKPPRRATSMALTIHTESVNSDFQQVIFK